MQPRKGFTNSRSIQTKVHFDKHSKCLEPVDKSAVWIKARSRACWRAKRGRLITIGNSTLRKTIKWPLKKYLPMVRMTLSQPVVGMDYRRRVLDCRVAVVPYFGNGYCILYSGGLFGDATLSSWALQCFDSRQFCFSERLLVNVLLSGGTRAC